MDNRAEPSEPEPRLRSALWVAAYMRRCQGGGAYAALTRRGDESAGAIFIEVLHATGTDLWGAAPGSDGRVFERILCDVPGYEVSDRVTREANFDADLWLVTIEDRQGRHFFEDHEHV